MTAIGSIIDLLADARECLKDDDLDDAAVNTRLALDRIEDMRSARALRARERINRYYYSERKRLGKDDEL